MHDVKDAEKKDAQNGGREAYEAPAVEVIRFIAEDIITTSDPKYKDDGEWDLNQ